MLITATRSASSWSRRRRRISSSVRRALPAPPVPVMPTTGIGSPRPSCSGGLQRRAPPCRCPSAVMSCASARQAARRGRASSPVLGRVRRRVVVAAHHHLADHPLRGPCAGRLRGCRCAPRRRPCSSAISLGHDHAAAAAEDLDVRRRVAQQVDHVLEVLDVAALVAADQRDACASSCSAAVTTSSTERLWPRWITRRPCPAGCAA